ncbi:MAG: protein-glutamate O-methyltransferase CheR [Arenibacterium sp.]
MVSEVETVLDASARDVAYTRDDFRRITNVLRDVSGIRMPDTNEALVYSRLAKRVRKLGLLSFQDYADLIGRDTDERIEMIEALTTNTTRFFREEYHFDIFAKELLPGIIETARSGGRVRLWSAACSSGEEPYTLAGVVLRDFADAARHDVRILATDIDRTILARAEQGKYQAQKLTDLPAAFKNTLFEAKEDEAGCSTIRQAVRTLVSFRYLNFMEPWPVRGPFDAIFCRNVMIYMEKETQNRVFSSLINVLRPGGLLFIGHSERISGVHRNQLEMIGKTAFRRLN